MGFISFELKHICTTTRVLFSGNGWDESRPGERGCYTEGGSLGSQELKVSD